MTPPRSLADHLQHWAELRPASRALIAGEQCLDFADLRHDIEQLAATTPASPRQPLIAQGDSLQLARLAYVASLQKRAFYPVDRLPAEHLVLSADVPPGTRWLIATSGSEGTPRLVRLGDAQLDAAAGAANRLFALGPDDLWLDCLPLIHIGGLSILWRCARAGAGVLLHDGFAAERVAADLRRHPVSHLSLVPAMLARLLDTGIAPPATLRCVMIGGAALAPTLHARATAAGWPLYPSYGMSETAAQVASWQADDGPWRPGLVGRPMPGHEVRIDAGGRICLRGPQVMSGYLDGSGIDADGWLRTGDLGELDADGRLTILGRADDMLISGGRNIHPLTVESCLAACPGIVDVAVTGQPDPLWGDLVVALLVGPASDEQVLDHARRHLPAAAVPRRLVRLDALPRNPTGKLERAALRQLAAGGGA